MDQEQVALRRELGFWDALTIGAGTMIGPGIFLRGDYFFSPAPLARPSAPSRGSGSG